MSRLVWNQVGERFYETGVDRGVLYPRGGVGVPWNGLVSVEESSAGGGVEPLYFDGVKYVDLVSGEDFKATIEAFSAPPEFGACDGTKTLSPGLYATQQPRKRFGFCYRTRLGNDLEGTDYGYKLHLVYNATAAPSGKSNRTLSNGATPDTRSWEVSTVPVVTSNYKPTAHLVIDSTKMDPYLLEEIEGVLYGRDGADPSLPTQAELLDILSNPITEPLSATI